MGDIKSCATFFELIADLNTAGPTGASEFMRSIAEVTFDADGKRGRHLHEVCNCHFLT